VRFPLDRLLNYQYPLASQKFVESNVFVEFSKWQYQRDDIQTHVPASVAHTTPKNHDKFRLVRSAAARFLATMFAKSVAITWDAPLFK
jgi:hypothetical protein